MYRHEHPRGVVALNCSTISIVEDDGKSEARVWDTGKAYWLPPNAPNTMAADVNQGAKNSARFGWAAPMCSAKRLI